jgi:hypothetical protein
MTPRMLTILIAPLVLAACGQAAGSPTVRASPARPIAGASAERPVVVELFQSQGCSSCPPADAVLNALAERPDVIALNFAVTYWDQLGWKDTFAKPAFTARQWDYAHVGGRTNVSTPQMIIEGRSAIVGGRPAEVAAVIARAHAAPAGPTILTDGATVTISGGTGSPAATLWLVRYDPRTIQVAIRAGENGGRTLPHRDIVRDLVPIGTWRGATVHYRLPSPATGLKAALLLQAGRGGPIIAAVRA